MTPDRFRDDWVPEPDDERAEFYAQASPEEAEEQARSDGWQSGMSMRGRR